MSSLRPSAVVALFCGDWHLDDKAPIARSVEKDWMGTQAGYIRQLKELQKQNRMAPIFVAGDLFNRWNSSAWLINHAITWLRDMVLFAIPGNHDVPYHDYTQLPRSAYWTLYEAGVISHLTPRGLHSIGEVTVTPFPHGHAITPPIVHNGLCMQVALVHDYIWTAKTGHEGAEESHRYANWMPRLENYDVAFFGDNHIPWIVRKEGKCTVVNCGTLMRRHSDEKELEPSVWLLHSDKSVTRHKLDCRQDRFLPLDESIAKIEKALEIDLAEFAAELGSLRNERLDFARTVLQWCKREKIPDRVKEVLLRCVSKVK